MERPRRLLPAGHRRVPGRASASRRRTRRRAAHQPAGRVPAPQGAEGRRTRGRARGRHAADLPAEPGRRRRVARPAGHLLEPGAGRLPGHRRIHRGEVMTQAATAAVRKQIVVEAPQERAFTRFTENFGDFKPREHNIMRSPIAKTVFEPQVGGHIVDVAEDGSECRWARVLAYEPHDRVVFSWDIGPDWQIVADPDNASEVEVRFIAETPQRTRIELEHRNIDRHGPGWEAVRDGIATDQGWPLYLDRYAALLAE